MNARGPFLSRPWLVAGTSLAAVGFLSLLLASPWDRPGKPGTQPLRIFCAAGLTTPIEAIREQYEAEYGVKSTVNYDGSGKLLATLRTIGGRGDLYISADSAHIAEAKSEGLVAEVIPLVVQRPVVVINEKTKRKLDKAGRSLVTLKDVLDADLKFVLADPDRASVGQLTRDVMEKAGLWSRLQDRLRNSAALASMVGTVNEVTQVVRTRDDFTGVIWTANAAAHADLVVIPVPEFAGSREPVQIGILSRSQQPTAALRLARYLAAPEKGGAIMKKHHYELQGDADAWEETPTINLSAGAMLLPGIEGVVTAFGEREGVTVNTSYAGCGILVGQMKGIKAGQNSTHFPDAYFACDQSFLDDVQPWFETGVAIARNPIVLAVPQGNPKNVTSLVKLADKDLRIGLGDPEKSALGSLTDRLLRKLGLHDRIYQAGHRQGIVHADTASDLLNKLQLGALDAAVVYRSTFQSSAKAKEILEMVELNVPDAVATQPFAIAQDSRHKYLMRRLLQAIVAAPSAERFQSLGFEWIFEGK